MTQLTKHFALVEWQCRSGEHVPDWLVPRARRVAEQLESLRRFVGGKPIKIVSGYRSLVYNERLREQARLRGKRGPAEKSQHIEARAADICIRGMLPDEVHAAIESLILRGRMSQGGIGLYMPSPTTVGFVHYDVRGARARWCG